MKALTLFGSRFSHDAMAHHLGKTTWRREIEPVTLFEPVPCYFCWALVGGGALYVTACFVRFALS